MDELRKGIAIGMLFGSGSEGHGNLMTKTATENGTYTASEEIDPETGEIFDPPKDGYSVFTVDLALDDKSVSLNTSQITGSQTAVFEYDPHSENPELEGYSLFTIDLSGVKDDIEDLQQRIADAETCRQQVIAALQRYDPDYDPAEGECPSDKVDEVVDEVGELEDELEQCHDCKDAVVAAIQQYVPSFTPDPTTCNIPDGVDEVYEQGKEDADEEYTFEQDPTSPTYPDPDFPDKIRDLIGNDNLTDDDVQIEVRYVDEPRSSSRHNIYYGFYTTDGAFLDRTQAFDTSMSNKLEGFKILDYTTGSYEFYWVTSPTDRYYYTGTSSHLIGYGDPTHSYTVSKNS